MKNVLIRGFLAAATIGSALLIGVAGPAGADESCALIVVCTDPAPPPAPAPDPAPDAPPAQQPAPDHRSSEEITADLLVMLNQERSSRGLSLFTRHADVDHVAAGWSDHLADQGQLSHNDAYFTEQSRRDHGGRALGENVAMDSEAQPAHEHLMASEHHRDNILDARFSVVGLGATYRDGSWWITEDFLQPAAAPAGHDIARSLPAPPAAAPASPAPAVAPQPPAPAADVDATSIEVAHGPHRLATAPGRNAGTTSKLSLPADGRGLPVPAAGIAVAGVCCVAGLFLRRRALVLATTS